MEQLRTIITAACMLSIAVALCNLMKPSKVFERQVRFLISLIFTISLAAPLLRIDWTLPPAELSQMQMDAQAAQLTQEASRLILTETQQRTQTALRDLLTENGITCPQLEVEIHIDDEQCISISEVSAVCSDAEKARGLLRSNCGEEVTLHVTEPAEEAVSQG